MNIKEFNRKGRKGVAKIAKDISFLSLRTLRGFSLRSEGGGGLCVLCGYILILLMFLSGCSRMGKVPVLANSYPSIYPDYINVTIPYNIAPLNFKVKGDCQKVEVRLSGRSTSIDLGGKYKIRIPAGRWKKLLNEQKNDSILVTVSAVIDGKLLSYRPFSIFVSSDKIDPNLSYRLIEPGYEVWHKLQICQRDLESFEEKVIIENNLLENGCINCHVFSAGDPSRSFFHLRNANGGTMIRENGKFRKLNTRTDSTISAGVYGNWHPGGRFIAFSTNVIIPEFHSIKNLRLEVYDTISDVVILDIERNEILEDPLLSRMDAFETFPAFSFDGKRLFFCSAKALKMPENYNSVRYSLCAVSFNPDKFSIGPVVDTLISAWQTGKTISQPKPSPDGKYILFTSFAYGNFPVWHNEADLHLLKLSDLSIDTIPVVNSDRPDSYHSWSSESRWFVFASKRDDGMYGKPYFAHIDAEGRCGKPFLLPQKDADFYDFFMKSYNIPELSDGPVSFSSQDVERAYKDLKAEPVRLRFKM